MHDKTFKVILATMLVLLTLNKATAANNLFEHPNQTRPLFVMDSMISAIKSCYYHKTGNALGDEERCYDIQSFCRKLENDRAVKRICGLFYQEDKSIVTMYYNWATSISLGAELIDGDHAIVHFTYEHPESGKRKHEYMRLMREQGLWYLSSF